MKLLSSKIFRKFYVLEFKLYTALFLLRNIKHFQYVLDNHSVTEKANFSAINVLDNLSFAALQLSVHTICISRSHSEQYTVVVNHGHANTTNTNPV